MYDFLNVSVCSAVLWIHKIYYPILVQLYNANLRQDRIIHSM